MQLCILIQEVHSKLERDCRYPTVQAQKVRLSEQNTILQANTNYMLFFFFSKEHALRSLGIYAFTFTLQGNSRNHIASYVSPTKIVRNQHSIDLLN